MKIASKLWIGLGVLAALSPLGLILPKHFKAGDAWGEWGADGIKELVGYVPQGLKKLSSLWSAPLQDYAFKGWEEKGLSHLNLAYIGSAIMGIALTVLVILFIGRFLTRGKSDT